MRPNHIHVFDGLRITTEHINHLQEAFHSAIQDMREILGLGSVYHGFEVSKEDNQTVTIQPGLAFDLQKNRIVCDEPKTLQIMFETDEEIKYVCIGYDQIQDGEVEGEFTLIWDSCSVTARDTMPEPEENLIAIAKLIKLPEAEDADFEIVILMSPAKDEKQKIESDAAMEEVQEVGEEAVEEIDESLDEMEEMLTEETEIAPLIL